MSIELVDDKMWNTIEQMLNSDFGPGVARKLRGPLLPVKIKRGGRIYIYLIPPEWRDRFSLRDDTFTIQSMGVWLGQLKEDHIDLSLSAAQRIANMTDRNIIVSNKGAEAFTYGRSILKQSVVRLTPGLLRGQRVIVLDERGVCLGVAALSVDSALINRLSAEDLVAKNLIDIGWYIKH